MSSGDFMDDIELKFFKIGHLLTPEAKKFIEDNDGIETYLNKKYDNIVITLNDLMKNVEEIKILKNLTFIPEKLTTETFLSFYNSKYEKMKKIFIERVGNDFVSINKIGRRGHVAIMGMVKEVKEKDGKKIIDVEDITGTISVIYNGPEEVKLDDVIGVRGMSAGSVIYADEILYPGVPIREATTGKGNVFIISGLDLDEAPTDKVDKLKKLLQMEEYNYLIVVGNIGDKNAFENFEFNKKTFVVPGPKDSKTYPSIPLELSKNKNIISLSNPAMIEINGVKFLIMSSFNMKMLKKRYLGKSSIILDDDYLVMDVVPDIVVSNGKPNIMNYKSITIINSGTLLDVMRPVKVNLDTREWKEYDGWD